MEKVRLGYIGCGFMAQKVHIPNFMSLPDCELIGLAEMRSELGKTVASRCQYKCPIIHRSSQRDPFVLFSIFSESTITNNYFRINISVLLMFTASS